MERFKGFIHLIVVTILSNCANADSSSINRLEFVDANNRAKLILSEKNFTYMDEGINLVFSFSDADLHRIGQLRFPIITVVSGREESIAKPTDFLSADIPDSEYYFPVNKHGRMIFFSSNKLFLTRTNISEETLKSKPTNK